MNFWLNWSFMAYMLARTGSFLGLEYLDMITTMVCLEMPFVGVLCHVGTGQLVCLAGYVAVFCMMGSFAKGNFQTEYYVFSETPSSLGSCRVVASPLVYVIGQLTGFL